MFNLNHNSKKYRKRREDKNRGKKSQRQWIKTVTNIVDINPMMLKIILKVNGQNAPIKRQIFNQNVWKSKTQLYVI